MSLKGITYGGKKVFCEGTSGKCGSHAHKPPATSDAGVPRPTSPPSAPPKGGKR